MRDYTTNEPVFSRSIIITEPTDPAHADNINMAPIQLLQNTISNRDAIPIFSVDSSGRKLVISCAAFAGSIFAGTT